MALNVEQFGSGYPGPYCFQTVTISYNGQTVNATITDKVRWTFCVDDVFSYYLSCHSAWDVHGAVSISLVACLIYLRQNLSVYCRPHGGSTISRRLTRPVQMGVVRRDCAGLFVGVFQVREDLLGAFHFRLSLFANQ